METKTETEIRSCTECGKQYEEEIFTLEGAVFNIPSICDPCSEKRDSMNAQNRREEAARGEYERVVPISYRKTDKAHPNFNTPLWNQLDKWQPEQGWIGLVGETGRSKTRCLSLLAKRLAWKGYKLEWCIATRYQWAAQRQWSDDEGPKAREWLRKWKHAEVLILDDLGKQKWTDSVEAEFFDMLEHRTSCELLTLWSANTHPEAMIKAKQLTKDRGAPIVGRLLDYSEIILV